MAASRWGIAVVGLVGVGVIGVLAAVGLGLAHNKWQADHPYGEVDGVLWRQVAASFDPLKRQIFSREYVDPDAESTPAGYVDTLTDQRWDGTEESASDLGLNEGVAVVYDIATSRTVASFSAFISSGPRPDVAKDDGGRYVGPDTLYTCLRVEAHFDSRSQPTVLFAAEHLDCPPALVEQLPADARYADPNAFNG